MLEVAKIGVDRSRIGWWALVLALAATFGYLVYSYVGTIVLGVFLYYAGRPAFERLDERWDSDRLAASVTILGFIVPILALLAYAAFQIFGNVVTGFGPDALRQAVNQVSGMGPLPDARWQLFEGLIEAPIRTLRTNGTEIQQLMSGGAVIFGQAANWLLHVSLALTLAFYLLRDGNRLEQLFRRIVGGADTTIYSYATAVDRDLEIIFFGNVLFVLAVSAIAAVVYWVANFFAPEGLHIPIPFVLAALTGISALIPIVVSKVVYVPLVLYLGYQATGADVSLTFPITLLAVSFIVLDILPQTFLQPYITGRKIQMGLMLFAYIFGIMLFGWYGMFLLPLLLVLGIQAVRMIVVELIHGEPIDSHIDVEKSLGSDPADGIVGDHADEGESTESATDGEGDASTAGG